MFFFRTSASSLLSHYLLHRHVHKSIFVEFASICILLHHQPAMCMSVIKLTLFNYFSYKIRDVLLLVNHHTSCLLSFKRFACPYNNYTILFILCSFLTYRLSPRLHHSLPITYSTVKFIRDICVGSRHGARGDTLGPWSPNANLFSHPIYHVYSSLNLL